jgi:hypothetical protein
MNSMKLFNNNLSVIFAGVLIISTCILWGAAIHADWWLIDDHEIFWLTNQEGDLAISDIWDILIRKTEFGSLSTGLRFRLSYYPTRLIERILWGDSPHVWHFVRIAGGCIFFLTLYSAVSRLTTSWVAFLLSLYLMSKPMWYEIWVRLGPGETYGAVGLSLALISFANLINPRRKSALLLLALNITASTALILAVTSKENMLPFSMLAILFFCRTSTSPTDYTALITKFFGSLLTIALVANAFIVAKMIFTMKTDIYGASAEFGGVMHGLYSWGAGQASVLCWITILSIAFEFLVLGAPSQRAKLILVTSTLLWFLYVWNVAFYKGQLPTGMRYDFPADVILPIVLTLLFFNLIDSLKVKFSEVIPASLPGALTGVILIGFIIYKIDQGSYSWHQTMTRQYVEKTKIFRARLDEIIQYQRQPDNNQVVLVADEPNDYEPVYSIRGFLKGSRALERPLMLYVREGGVQASPLIRVLWEHQNFGGPGFIPFVKLQKFGLCVVFGGESNLDLECEQIVSISKT